MGYRWVDPGPKQKTRLELDPATAPIVGRIINGIAGGASARQTALALIREGAPTPTGRSATWHVSTIRGLLANPIYGGEPVAYRWSVAKEKGKRRQHPRPASDFIPLGGAAPAIVDREVLQAAQSG